MNPCAHAMLELLPEKKNSLRCRRCHLTISTDELAEGFCPECFANDGTRRYEFEELDIARRAGSRYRCEQCGVIIEIS